MKQVTYGPFTSRLRALVLSASLLFSIAAPVSFIHAAERGVLASAFCAIKEFFTGVPCEPVSPQPETDSLPTIGSDTATSSPEAPAIEFERSTTSAEVMSEASVEEPPVVIYPRYLTQGEVEAIIRDHISAQAIVISSEPGRPVPQIIYRSGGTSGAVDAVSRSIRALREDIASGAISISGGAFAGALSGSANLSALTVTNSSVATFSGSLAVGTSTMPTDGIFMVGSDFPSFFVDGSSGNVGIGTTSLSGNLHVESAKNSDSALVVGTASTNFDTYISLHEAGIEKWKFRNQGDSSDKLRIGSGESATVLTITQAGQVGIGMVGPTALLHLAAGTLHGNTAPLKFTSGPLMSTAEPGTIEYLDHSFYIRGSDGISIAGNVGIGTTSPFAVLSVASNSSNRQVVVSNTSGNAGIDIVSGSSFSDVRLSSAGGTFSGITYDNPNSRLNLYNQNAGISINSSGNVGIGTTTPAAKLDIHGGNVSIANNTPVLAFRDTDSAAGAITPSIQFSDSAGTLRSYLGMDGSSNMYFRNRLSGSNILYTNDTERMRIDSAGNVGIGTTTPGYKLEVQGTTYFNGNQTTNGNYYITGSGVTGHEFGIATHKMRSVGGVVWSTSNDATGSADLGLSRLATGKLAVGNGTVGDSSGTLIAGNIGIGTTTPAVPLVVQNSNTTSRIPTLQIHNSAAGAGIIGFGANTLYNTAFIGTSPANGLVVGQAAGDLALWAENRNILFSTAAGGGSAQMYISSAGNVGIGTTTPATKLVINHSAASSVAESLRLVNSGSGNGSGNRIGFTVAGDENNDAAFIQGIYTSTTGNHGLQFGTGGGNAAGTDGTVRLTITGAGKVGVGTASPALGLHIVGANSLPATSGSTQTGIARIQGDGSGVVDIGTISGGGAWLQVTNAASLSVNYDLILNPNGGNVGIGTTNPNEKLEIALGNIRLSDNYRLQWGANGAGVYGNAANKTLHLSTNGAERVRVDLSGNVGIGTTTPVSRLHVASGSANPLSTAISTAAQLVISDNDAQLDIIGVNGGAFSAGLSIADVDTVGALLNKWGLVRQSTSGGSNLYLTYGTNRDAAANTPNVVFEDGGNVGIGTTSPYAKFSVAGLVVATDYYSSSGSVGFKANNLLGGATTLSTDANGNIIRTPSDANLKEKIQPLSNALEKVKALRGVSYEWKDKERFGSFVDIGFIAQEVETVVPEVVKSGGDYKSLNYGNLVALVVEAIKELASIIESLAQSMKNVVADTLSANSVYVKEATIDNLSVGSLRLNGDICIENTCVTKEQFKAILEQSGATMTVYKNESNELAPSVPSHTEDAAVSNEPSDMEASTSTTATSTAESVDEDADLEETEPDETATTTETVVQEDIGPTADESVPESVTPAEETLVQEVSGSESEPEEPSSTGPLSPVEVIPPAEEASQDAATLNGLELVLGGGL